MLVAFMRVSVGRSWHCQWQVLVLMVLVLHQRGSMPHLAQDVQPEALKAAERHARTATSRLTYIC